MTYRVALIDDHEIVARGFAQLFDELGEIDVVATVADVDALLQALVADAAASDSADLAALPPLDLVILDLRLADGSAPAENVRRLREIGADVLAFTGGEDPALVRSAARSGVLGVIRKSEPAHVLKDAVLQAARGETVASTEWAAALDGDPELADAALSARESEALALYASGAKTQLVAQSMSLSESTVLDYIRRVRAKYDRVGRPASTKVELYKRALEDGILPYPGQGRG